MSPVFRAGALSVGVDLHERALTHLREASPVAGDALRLPFAAAAFDVVGCFDLLYHQRVPRVDHALAEIRRVIRPGGVLLVTDSACPSLYGAHDRAHHGARRFTRSELCERLREAGFDIEHASHLHVAVFPLVWLARVGGRTLSLLQGSAEPEHGRSQLEAASAPVNTLFRAWYAVEAPAAARWRLPFGVTVFVLARARERV